MEEVIGNEETYVSKEVTDGSRSVVVIADLIEEGMWELRIVGKNHQAEVWTEWFSTSNEAINVGMSAILAEGFDDFYANPEFSYLE